MANEQNLGNVWGKVVAQSWSDDDFKSRVLSEPRKVLSEAGLNLPDEVEISVSDGGPARLHLVIPDNPQGDTAIGDEALEAMSGGNHCCYCQPLSGSGGR